MQTSASNVLLSPALTTATPRTTALWIGSWWAPMSRILPWISAPTASPSARSDSSAAAAKAAAFLYKALDGKGIIV